MSVKTYTDLLTQIDEIREEDEVGGNSKDRIAQMFEDNLDSVLIYGGEWTHATLFPSSGKPGIFYRRVGDFKTSGDPDYVPDNSWIISNIAGADAFEEYTIKIDAAPGGGEWGSITGTLADQTDLQSALNGKQASLGFTPENAANKATDFSTLNNTLYPSVQAVENRIGSALAGLKWKDSVRVATTVAGTLASSFENGDTVDGVVLATGNRILIKDQATQSENGIYTVNASGAPTRSTDADSATELEGATVTAQEGTSNANTTWNQITDGITLGSSNIVWTQFGSSVPDATPTVKGIAKLYTSTGSNTDGAMDQNSNTNELALKVAKAGDTMGGNLAMGGNKVTGLGAATTNGDAVRFEQLPAAASESSAGLIEIATQAETDTGTDDLSAITPLKGATKYANKLETINTQTADYTLVLTDKDIKTVVMNIAATSNTVTVPPNSSVAFPVGSIITIAQLGTGLTSVAAGAGVTIRSSTGALAGQGQYSPMVIEKIATDEWFLWNGPPALAGAALTRTNDTNITATLSGSPSTALLAAVDIALAWTGTLAVTRGGTGLSASANGDVVIGTGTNTMGVVNALATTRTAYWHLKAGTATASTAPVKYNSGTLLTVVEAGAREFNGAHYLSSAALNRVGIGGPIADFTADVANSGTSETDIHTYTTKASTLSATGEKLTFEFTMTLSDVTATAQIKVLFGGTVIGDTGALTISAIGAVVIRGWIIRTGASTARASVNISSPTASTAVYTAETDLTGLTFTNTNILKTTATAGGAGGGSNDITGKMGTIFWWPAAANA